MPLRTNYSNQRFNDYQKLEIKNKELSKENDYLKYEKKLLEKQYKTLEQKYNKLKETIEKNEQKKFQAKLDEKDKEIARLKALLNNDGTNSGISTSKTHINKNKVIPNSRKKSGKNVGGQKGHKKHKLEKFKDEEITEV